MSKFKKLMSPLRSPRTPTTPRPRSVVYGSKEMLEDTTLEFSDNSPMKSVYQTDAVYMGEEGSDNIKWNGSKGISSMNEDGNICEQTFTETGSLSHSLELMMHDKTYADVIFVVGPNRQRFYGHRALLGRRSLQLQTLFSQADGSGECYGQAVRVIVVEKEHIDPTVFSTVLRYLYTANITLNLRDALPILALAAELQIHSLVEICCVFLRNHLSASFACDVLEAALEFQCEDLAHRTLSFIDRSAPAVLHSSAFLRLSRDTLIKILQRNSLAVDELDLFEGVIRWGQENTKSTVNEEQNNSLQNLMANVLPHIRFPLMSSEALRRRVEPLEVVPQDLLFEAYRHLAAPHLSTHSTRTTPRTPPPRPSRISLSNSISTSNNSNHLNNSNNISNNEEIEKEYEYENEPDPSPITPNSSVQQQQCFE
eukprot:gb/GECH01003909.1/.p1 GENE.gb/GECH01003909.1/~~gb/GECH01003909.1/.p1  ORF type:complete len:425 (+),score=129.07 gb/GECH01003909.1/:1-1275(+)